MPHQVIAHLRDITVAPGKAYPALAFSPQLTEGIHRLCRYCLTPSGSSLKRKLTGTDFRSNALFQYMHILYNFCSLVKGFVFPRTGTAPRETTYTAMGGEKHDII